jgi:glycosyltransferase involved in cell wall biosynthesis
LKVAVAIALYNGERFVWDQLSSLLRQTRRPDTVVLCDDGSKDDTKATVRRFIRENGLEEQWHLYENPKNLGYIKNFYQAIRLSDADLVFLCDQDDLWDDSKIEKMAFEMEKNESISLLSCRYGIIDGDGNALHSVVEKNKKGQSGAVTPVSVREIARATRWPGMTMCIRKSFFELIDPIVGESKVIHDMAMAMCAAKNGAFYEMDYVGAYHRRHQNNAAREEHRVSKLLDLKRKLYDIRVTIPYWEEFASDRYGLAGEDLALVKNRLELLKSREKALEKKSLWSVISLYARDGGKLLRPVSFVCDVYLALFGKA